MLLRRPKIRGVKDPTLAPSTLELLAWVDTQPRTYAQAIEAWGSWCPRHAAWEDALADRLIRVRRDSVVLTPAGQEALRRAA
jgi:hypothetical protein